MKLVDRTDPILHTMALLVANDPIVLADLAHKLCATLRECRGEAIGVALPQIGISLRGFAMTEKLSPANQFFFNPEILTKSKGTWQMEGCMSLDRGNERYRIKRSDFIRGRWMNASGDTIEANFSGLAARCFQHELDHLNGILISDIGR